MHEKRIPDATNSTPTALPVDYVKMVGELLSKNFANELQELQKFRPGAWISPRGGIFSDEIMLTVSLLSSDKLWATTFHASADFDPKASKPKAEEVLAACLDAIGSLLAHFLDLKNTDQLRAIVSDSLSEIQSAPFDWTPFEFNRRQVFVKIDKSNPVIDQAATDWLKKNDPDARKRQKEEEKEREALFITPEKIADPSFDPSSESDDD